MHAVLSMLAIAMFAVAAFTDLHHRRIPNTLVLALFAIGLLRIGIDLHSGSGLVLGAADIAAMALTLTATAVLFHYGLLGGGDAKLLSAGTLWIGVEGLGAFLLTTALAGGVLAVAFLLGALLTGGLGQTRRSGLPYGVAIAAGGILVTSGLV